MHAAFASEAQIEKHRSKGANLCDIWHSDIRTENSIKRAVIEQVGGKAVA
jgi:hypothetical protein